jgi:hypothetical protein
MKKFPKEFQPFVSLVQKSKTFDAAFAAAQQIKDVSAETAAEFHELYGDGEGRMDMRAAFNKFYLDVKHGQYIFEGELDRIKQLIREELGGGSFEEYTKALDAHDWYYAYSDRGEGRSSGERSERRIMDIYKGLNPEDKQRAAIYYKQTFIRLKLFAQTTYGNVVREKWNPESPNFDASKFDGVYYRG